MRHSVRTGPSCGLADVQVVVGEMRKAFLLFLCLCTPFSYAEEEGEKPRILTLIPQLLIPFAVEPSIPEDFVAKSATGGAISPYDWIYWGPEDTLTEYFNDPTSLKRPIIRVKLSANTSQWELENEGFKDLKSQGMSNASILNLKWGNYPVYSLSCDIANQTMFIAWVGLNVPEGWTLMFQMIYPDKPKRPNKQDKQFWNAFLKKTSPLSLVRYKEFFEALPFSD